MGKIRARLAKALFAAFVSTILFAAPLPALGATFSNEMPTGTIGRAPILVGTTAFSATALRSGSQLISVDGVTIKALINAGSTSGYWAASEVWDPAKQAYVVKWTWVKSTTSPNKATIYGYPTMVLGDGVHNVAASIKDTAGVTSIDRWSFTVGVPPVFGTPVPAPDSTVDTLTPAISVPVSDNDPRPMTATATVNGVAVAATVSGGSAVISSPKLPNDETATVVVTIRDATGIPATKTWSFKVLIYADMFNMIGDCSSCHPTAATDPDMHEDCAMCHAGMIDTPHQGTPASLHPNTDSSCTPCHVTELTNEHARWLSKAGTPITCMTCHTSTDPAVVSAIALGNAQCGSCHDANNPHQGLDMSATHSIDPLSETFVIQGVDLGSHACTDCHYANIVNDHGGDCTACHPTAAAAATPWDKRCASVGCHTPTSSVPMHTTLDSDHNQPAFTATSCATTGCHDANSFVPFTGRSIADLHSAATTTVAGENRATCTICHRPGVTATNDCLTAGCHADRANPHGYLPEKHQGTPTAQTFLVGGVTYPAVACSSCHNTELGPEHTKPTSTGNTGCGECHPTRVAQLPQPWDKTTCAQGNCHAGTSTEPLHGTIDSAHARRSANDACFASGCHTGANLVAIHAAASTTVGGVTRTSCMVCHADGIPASTDCTTCHADKVASHYDAQQHTASVTSATMTIQGKDLGTHACADCHASMELGPVHSNNCGTCHPTPAASAKPWNGECATVDCHTAGSTRPMHEGIDAAHNQPALLGDCEVGGCHDANGPVPLTGKSIAEIHSAATTTTAGVTRTSCTICHATGVTLTNDCLTAGCHADRGDPHGYNAATHTGTPKASSFLIGGVTYPSVPCANCHEVELGIEHVKPTSSGNTGCLECHAVLVSQLPQPWDRTTCAQGNCHTGTSTQPLHGTIDAAHNRLPANDACFAAGCHSGANLAAVHSDATTTVAGVPRTSCMVCHADGIPTSADCTSCHPEKVVSHYDAAQHTATMTSAPISIKGVDFGTHACSECHGTGELGPIHSDNCATCHPQPAKSAKPWDKNCATANCHTAGSTRPMHGQIDSAHTISPVSCTDVGCHSGEGNVAAVHAKEGCPTCHADGKTPTLTCTSAGCHANMDGHGDVTATHASTETTGDIEIFAPSSSHAIERSGQVVFTADCSMCHRANNLVDIHGRDCTLCHMGSSPPRDSFTTWNKTCQQGDCHPTFHTTASGGHDYEYTVDDSCSCHNYDYSSANPSFCGSCHFVGPDNAAPLTQATVLPSYDGTAAIPFTATDNDRVKATYARVDGQAASTVQGGVVIVSPPATGTANHSIEYWSVDWAGNVELPHHTALFSVDADITSPVTTSDAKSTYIGPAVVHLTPTDNGTNFGVRTTYYRFDDGPTQVGTVATYPQPVSGTESHTLYFWSIDYAGNVEPENQAAFTITADRVAPVTTSDLEPAPRWYPGGPLLVSLASVDPAPSSGVVGVHLDSTNPSAWWGDYHEAAYNAALGVWQLKVWPQASGNYAISWAARDNAGNVEPTKTVTIQVDAQAPVSSTNVIAGTTYVGNQTFSLSAVDTGGSGLASTWWQLDSTAGTWTSGTSVPVSAPTSNTVTHVLYFYSRDYATNQEYRQAVQFNIKPTGDSSGPTGSIVINSNAVWTTSTACTLTLSATDPSGVWQMRFSNDNVTWSDWQAYATSKPWVLDSTPGTRRVYAQFRDTIGNMSTTYSDTIGLDPNPPTGTITIKGGAVWTNSVTTSLTLSATDGTGSGMSQMRFSNDNSSWSAWETYATSKATWSMTAGSGTKTIWAQYRDVAGNMSVPCSDTIGVDLVAPVTTSNITLNGVYTGTQTFTLSPTDSGGSGVAGTWWQLDSTAGVWTSGTSVRVSTVGNHTLYWYSRDNAGSQEANKSVSFRIQ